MEKVLVFKVCIEGAENKIWREIEIIDSDTVADLVYVILSSFNSLAYHGYEITHGINKYVNFNDLLESFGDEIIIEAPKVQLNEKDFTKNDKMILNYDFGTPTTFIIKYQSPKILVKGEQDKYPCITKGEGCGMIDDISSDELVDIIEETDKKGKSNFYYTSGYEKCDIYDYRKYDIAEDNRLLKEKIKKIKTGYESEEKL